MNQLALFKMIGSVDQNTFGKMIAKANTIKNILKGVFREHLNTVELLSDNEFWSMVKDLRKQIEGTMPDKTSTSLFYADMRLATDRFFHSYVFGKDVEKALSFVRTYRVKSDALYRPLFDVIEGFGDDGYGDVLDSFPLFGKKRYEKALNGEIEGTSEAQYQGVTAKFQSCPLLLSQVPMPLLVTKLSVVAFAGSARSAYQVPLTPDSIMAVSVTFSQAPPTVRPPLIPQ